MDWEILRDEIYYLDGSLRDIYVLNTERDDWGKWIDFVNNNYPIEFVIGGSDNIQNQIDKKAIFNCWDSKERLALSCTVKVGDIIIKCYFFCEEEIENDITPLEIKSIDDHYRLMEYLKKVSLLLNKRVILSEESYREDRAELIIVENKIVKFNISD